MPPHPHHHNLRAKPLKVTITYMYKRIPDGKCILVQNYSYCLAKVINSYQMPLAYNLLPASSFRYMR